MQRRAAIVRVSYFPQDMLVHREASALDSIGFEVHVFCLRGNQTKEEEIDNIRIHRLPLQRKRQGAHRNLFEYVAFFFLVAFRLTTMHVRCPFSVIQVNTMPDFLVFATLIPRIMGAKVTLQMYEPMPELWLSNHRTLFPVRLLKHVEQWSLRYAHAAFTVTQTLKERFVSRGADAKKVTVVLNAPDEQLFTRISLDPVISSNDSFTLVCHGTIDERYGYDTILHAVAKIRSFIPGIQLRVMGRGRYLKEFLRKVQVLDLQDTVRYLGFVSLDQLAAELQIADVGIVAQEASPYSQLVHTGKMYDYLAFGKPVIASRLKALQAYFGEDSLCFFSPGDPDDLARALIELYRQPEKRQTLIKNSQVLYRLYRWQVQRESYVSVYRGLFA